MAGSSSQGVTMEENRGSRAERQTCHSASIGASPHAPPGAAASVSAPFAPDQDQSTPTLEAKAVPRFRTARAERLPFRGTRLARSTFSSLGYDALQARAPNVSLSPVAALISSGTLPVMTAPPPTTLQFF